MMEVTLSEHGHETQSKDGTLTDQFSKTRRSDEHTHFITFYIFSAHTNFDLYTFCHFMKECLLANFITVHTSVCYL